MFETATLEEEKESEHTVAGAYLECLRCLLSLSLRLSFLSRSSEELRERERESELLRERERLWRYGNPSNISGGGGPRLGSQGKPPPPGGGGKNRLQLTFKARAILRRRTLHALLELASFPVSTP